MPDPDQERIELAATPLKLTVLVPCVAPKLFPEMTTGVVTGPEVGERNEMDGVGVPPEPVVSAAPTLKKVEGLLWLLYSVATQSALRATVDTRNSSSCPF